MLDVILGGVEVQRPALCESSTVLLSSGCGSAEAVREAEELCHVGLTPATGVPSPNAMDGCREGRSDGIFGMGVFYESHVPEWGLLLDCHMAMHGTAACTLSGTRHSSDARAIFISQKIADCFSSLCHMVAFYRSKENTRPGV